MGVSESKQNTTTNNHRDPKTALITSPHSKCEHDLSNHYCDTISLRASQYLYQALTDNKWIVTYIRGDINRKKIDLNRIQSRHTTSFRKSITRIYNENKERPDAFWILDIHSYPDGHYASEPSECVLLFPFANRDAENYNRRLMRYLDMKGISVLSYNGSKDNDITTQATFNYDYKYVFLIEISETLANERLRFIMNTIADWMNSRP